MGRRTPDARGPQRLGGGEASAREQPLDVRRREDRLREKRLGERGELGRVVEEGESALRGGVASGEEPHHAGGDLVDVASREQDAEAVLLGVDGGVASGQELRDRGQALVLGAAAANEVRGTRARRQLAGLRLLRDPHRAARARHSNVRSARLGGHEDRRRRRRRRRERRAHRRGHSHAEAREQLTEGAAQLAHVRVAVVGILGERLHGDRVDARIEVGAALRGAKRRNEEMLGEGGPACPR